DEVYRFCVDISMRVLSIAIRVLQRRRRNVKAGGWIIISLNQRIAARLTVIGDQCPPIAGMAGIGKIIESRLAIRVIRMIGAIGVYLHDRLIEKGGVVVIQRIYVRVADSF